MASESGATSGAEKAADLRALGATAVNRYITRAEADADSIVRQVDSATGVWFGGGDQVRLANVLRGSRTLAAIRVRYVAGAVIGGTSTGAAVMSAVMLTGDQKHPGGARPPSDSTAHWLIIEPSGLWRAAGASVVTIYDARRATPMRSATAPLGAANVRLHILPAGSTYDPATGRAAVPWRHAPGARILMTRRARASCAP